MRLPDNRVTRLRAEMRDCGLNPARAIPALIILLWLAAFAIAWAMLP